MSSGKQPQRDGQEQEVELQGDVPKVMVQQAEAAASSNAGPSDQAASHHAGRDVPAVSHSDSMDTSASELNVPPPAYGEVYGEVEDQQGSGTKATMGEDGRVNIRIDQNARNLSHLLVPALRHQQETLNNQGPPPPAYIPPSLGGEEGVPPPPPMNVVIHVVGSRGDVQPFVALGKVLKDTYGHRVRLATHPVFQKFVTENGLEFFSIGGDPSELMAFMVKNPGLMPGFDVMRNGDVGKRRKEIATMIKGCWRSCFETGDGTGPAASDQTAESYSSQGEAQAENADKPFVADAIIANPPSFAHVHVAEKLGIPLHVMFTMPYSPTQAFPHPLANIQSTNADQSLTNYISYVMVEMLTWQGLGDLINRFRNKELGLEDINMLRAPGMLQRMKIPHTYCWSPALIPKPKDWGQHISISGFYFLNLATDYTPEPDLKAFLDAGPPPVYIGFGSIVLDDPNAMTKTLFEAVKKSGQRALVSKGWGGMGADELGKPDNVFMLGNVPHDWLFKHVSAVVHHGGAGTTAAGITAGRPTLVVPFFGDQPFWGAMVHRAGAGPEPIPHKQLTADNLADGIKVCLKPESQEKAHAMAATIAKERGSDIGAQSFHQFLDMDTLRCSLAPSRAAVWSIKRTDVRLSAMAACTLANEGLLDFKELKLFRGREYEVDDGPLDPITGGATSIIGTASTMMMGFADMPIETLKALKIHPDATKKKPKAAKGGEKNGKADDAASDKPPTERTDSSTDAATPNKDSTPATSRSGSTFNFQESLSKFNAPSSPSGSRSGSMAPSSGGKEESQNQEQQQKQPKDSRKYMETAMGSAEGVQRIVGAGFKSPMDFTMNLSKGFRNAPKLYGDDSVRKPEKVTDFKSGIRAAGREFGFGMYDGITGLVTQPMKGAQKEGAAGFIKGFAKGIGGIALKPGAAVFGIPGYTMQGVYKEMQKQMGSSVQNYIIAARTAQGYEEWSAAHPEERSDVVRRWQQLETQLRKKRNADDVVKEIFEEARRKRMESLPQGKQSGSSGTSTNGQTGAPSGGAQQAPDPDALEAAIRESIRQTSRGNPEEDAAIERAIRVSMSELARQSGAAKPHDDDDEALRKAMAASTQGNEQQGEGERDDELERALANSLKEQRRQYDQDDDDNDEEYQQALRESQAAGGSNAGEGSSAGPSHDQGHLGGVTREQFEQSGGGKDEKSQEEKDEERIVMEYVKKQSLKEKEHQSGKAGGGKGGAEAKSGQGNGDDEDDEELRRAMEESMKDQKSA